MLKFYGKRVDSIKKDGFLENKMFKKDISLNIQLRIYHTSFSRETYCLIDFSDNSFFVPVSRYLR